MARLNIFTYLLNNDTLFCMLKKLFRSQQKSYNLGPHISKNGDDFKPLSWDHVKLDKYPSIEKLLKAISKEPTLDDWMYPSQQYKLSYAENDLTKMIKKWGMTSPIRMLHVEEIIHQCNLIATDLGIKISNINFIDREAVKAENDKKIKKLENRKNIDMFLQTLFLISQIPSSILIFALSIESEGLTKNLFDLGGVVTTALAIACLYNLVNKTSQKEFEKKSLTLRLNEHQDTGAFVTHDGDLSFICNRSLLTIIHELTHLEEIQSKDLPEKWKYTNKHSPYFAGLLIKN